MQILLTHTKTKTMNNAQQLAVYLSEVRDYFTRRQIKNYAVVLTAIDPTIDAKMSRLRLLWAAKKEVAERDADLVARCCRVVEVLKDSAGV